MKFYPQRLPKGRFRGVQSGPMRTRIETSVAVLIMALTAFSANAVTAGEFVPLRGEVTGHYSTVGAVPDLACEGGLTLSVLGSIEGHLSGIGKYTENQDITFSTCDSTYFGTGIATTANGDLTFNEFSGQYLPDPVPGNPEATLTLTHGVITGGTGRFEDATGTWVANGIRVPLSLTESMQTLEVEGMISSVGSTKRVQSVPEPTSLSSLACLLGLATFFRRRRLAS
jgi:hypothetical protein